MASSFRKPMLSAMQQLKTSDQQTSWMDSRYVCVYKSQECSRKQSIKDKEEKPKNDLIVLHYGTPDPVRCAPDHCSESPNCLRKVEIFQALCGLVHRTHYTETLFWTSSSCSTGLRFGEHQTTHTPNDWMSLPNSWMMWRRYGRSRGALDWMDVPNKLTCFQTWSSCSTGLRSGEHRTAHTPNDQMSFIG